MYVGFQDFPGLIMRPKVKTGPYYPNLLPTSNPIKFNKYRPISELSPFNKLLSHRSTEPFKSCSAWKSDYILVHFRRFFIDLPQKMSINTYFLHLFSIYDQETFSTRVQSSTTRSSDHLLVLLLAEEISAD